MENMKTAEKIEEEDKVEGNKNENQTSASEEMPAVPSFESSSSNYAATIVVVPENSQPAVTTPDNEDAISVKGVISNQRVPGPVANRHSKLVARHPLILCLTLLFISLGMVPLTIVIRGLPDFSDPKVGVEPRGIVQTEAEHTFKIARDMHRNTQRCKELKCDEGDKVGDCSLTASIHAKFCPREKYQSHDRRRLHFSRSRIIDEDGAEKQLRNDKGDDDDDDDDDDDIPSKIFPQRHLQRSAKRCPGWTYGRKRLWKDVDNGWRHHFVANSGTVGYAYEVKDYDGNGDLLEPAKLKSMCEAGKMVTKDRLFREIFCLRNQKDGGCCPAESLTSFVSYIAGKKETCDVTQEDADKVRQLIGECEQYRKSIITAFSYWAEGMTWSPASEPDIDVADALETEAGIDQELRKVKSQVCKDWYLELAGLYEYLISENWRQGDAIKSSNVYIPVMSMEDHGEGFHGLLYDTLIPILNEQELKADGIMLEDPDGRFTVFDIDVMADGKYTGLSFCIIFCIMLFHNGSFFITAAAFGQIFLSLSLTLFLYQVVFWVPYFPFMNLVCLFVLIGIGVDDVFIYYDAWCQSFYVLTEDTLLENRIQWTLERAGSAMFMTSITTAAAFFSNMVSSVTGFKLFAIFSSLVIMADYFLMITMLPCIVVLGEGMCAMKNGPKFRLFPLIEGKPRKVEEFLATTFVDLILKLRYPLIVIMTAWGVFCFYEAYHIPMPNDDGVPLWIENHPLEVWRTDHMKRYSGTKRQGRVLYVNINIGYKAEDNGYYLNPTIDGRGTVQYVETNFAAKASQTFYLDLCEKAKQWTLVDALVRKKGSDEEREFEAMCWPLGYKKWFTSAGVPLKCKNYPLEESDFEECLYLYLDDTDRWVWRNFIFDMRTKAMKEMHLYIKTTKEWKGDYNYMDEQYNLISTWALKQIENAPAEELRDVNWHSNFRYYGLQGALSDGAKWSSLLAMMFALLAILAMTRRLDVSVLSVVSIFMILSSLVASVKWLGWTVNINEGPIFSMAVGASVDFVCHLAYAYCTANYNPSSKMDEREFRLRFALGTVGISVTAAAFTTMIGGSAMILSIIMFYNRFGIYLVLAMIWSWVYAFFYFTSLLAVYGPKITTSSSSWGLGRSLGGSLYKIKKDRTVKVKTKDGEWTT